MSTNTSRVLLFDDYDNWINFMGDLIKNSIPGIRLSTVKNAQGWERHVSSSLWDAIIVDVQLDGDSKNGVEHALDSIWNDGTFAPIILVSNAVNLDLFDNKYGKMFFKYIDKSDFADMLPTAVKDTFMIDKRIAHVNNVLMLIGQKLEILDSEVPAKLLPQYSREVQEHFSSNDDKTLRAFIDSVIYGPKTTLDNNAKGVLYMMKSMTSLKSEDNWLSNHYDDNNST